MDHSVFSLTKASVRPVAVVAFWAAATATAMLTLGAPAGATERHATSPQPRAEPLTGAAQPAPSELAREGLAKMLQALDALAQSVPQYHLPEISGNGDIIIRRKQPEKPQRSMPDNAPRQQPAPPQRQAPPAERGPGTPI